MATKQELELQLESLKEEILMLRNRIKDADSGVKKVASNFSHPAVTVLKDAEGTFMLKLLVDIDAGEGKVIEKVKVDGFQNAHHNVSKYLSENVILPYMRGEKVGK